MMGLVRLALRRPYTSAMVAFFVMLAGALSLTRMVVDIFPKIDIPVVLVAWNYGGLSAEEMERRVVLVAERSYAQNVDGVDRIESQSDDRTANNAVRHTYRVLNDAEKAAKREYVQPIPPRP
jgi:multidrug efflux pump subunit AcrB